MPAAPLLEAAVVDAAGVVEEVDVPVAVGVEVALEEALLEEDVELSVESKNTPPAIESGETVVAFLAACL